MSLAKRCAKTHGKARQRRRHSAQERLARDRRQAHQAAEALQQALDALGLPEDLVAEIEGRLHSQHTLLGKIVGVMCPPIFGGCTKAERWRVRGWDNNLPWRLRGALPKRSWLKRLRRVGLKEFYMRGLDTAISGPQLLRAWKRRSWIEHGVQTLKHLLATAACKVHSEEAYDGHLVLRLMGCCCSTPHGWCAKGG